MADTQDQTRKTYRGNCHCGAFVYEIDVPEIKTVGECDCSLCRRKGYLFVFPGLENFRVVKGDIDELSLYMWGPRKLEHRFCGKCGIPVLGRGAGEDVPIELQMAVNAHTLQGINTWPLERKHFDGKNWRGVGYDSPPHKGHLPSAEIEGGKTYTGSCHCGKLTVALNSLPLDENSKARITECNCSICERGAYIWTYPKKEHVVLSGAPEDIGRYAFASNLLDKTFCKTCGVHLTNELKENPDPKDVGNLPEEALVWMRAHHPVNLRVFDEVDITKIPKAQVEAQDRPPLYVNP